MQDCIDHGQYGGERGYATRTIPGTTKRTSTHRVVYMQTHGLTPEDLTGMVIRHTCDNPRCVNPEHLITGTQQQNMDDKVERGRCPKPSRKVSDADIEYIRKHYKARDKEFGATALGRRFGITMNSVWRIVNGVTFNG